MAINPSRRFAQDAVNKKRNQLGNLVGNPSSDLVEVEDAFNGFVQHFDNGLDIYVSADTEVHEVHGDIKRKYDTLAPPSGKGFFGLPITDESSAANGGRFNDFLGDKSIYWHPSIGPRLVSGPMRDFWKQQGRGRAARLSCQRREKMADHEPRNGSAYSVERVPDRRDRAYKQRNC